MTTPNATMIRTLDPFGREIVRAETAGERLEREHWEKRERQINGLAARDDRYLVTALQKKLGGGRVTLAAIADLIGRPGDLATAVEVAAAENPGELGSFAALEARFGIPAGKLEAVVR